MKELSIKEKAKRYDEAIEIARKLNNGEGVPAPHNWTAYEVMFPELKESEDDKIRKELLEHCKNQAKPYIQTGNKCPQIQSWIDWLEKKGQTFTKKDVDDAYLKGISDTKNEMKKQHEATYQIRKDIATFIFNYRGDIKDRAKWMDYLGIKVSFAEKQGEQKSTNSKEDDVRRVSTIQVLEYAKKSS